MVENQDDDKKAIIKFALHHSFMMLMVVIIVFAIGYAYISMSRVNVHDVSSPISTNSKGVGHPLPDFIVDNVQPDELDILKP